MQQREGKISTHKQMEWELSRADAEALREEARHTTRIRINPPPPSSSSSSTTVGAASNCRPKVGEMCLIELQGELVLPSEQTEIISGAAPRPKPKEKMSGRGDIYTVGTISEDDPKAAKSKAMLRMGTLSVDGERAKNPGATLVVLDKQQQQRASASLEEGATRVRPRGDEEFGNNSTTSASTSSASSLFAPPLSSWSFGDQVSDEQLLAALEKHSHDSGDSSRGSYTVIGTLSQRYLFKAKPFRQMEKTAGKA